MFVVEAFAHKGLFFPLFFISSRLLVLSGLVPSLHSAVAAAL